MASGIPFAGTHGLDGTFTYARDLFDRSTIEHLAGSFQKLLAAAVAEPHRPLADLLIDPGSLRNQP